MNIHLHIDQLVLNGLPVTAGDSERIRAAVTAELTRLLAQNALPPDFQRGGARAAVPAAEIQLSGNDSPTSLSQQIGQAVYGGLSR